MKMRTIYRQPDGTHAICEVGGDVVIEGGFPDQASAWRRLDQMQGEVVSPAEKRTDFAWNKRVHGE